ncbi:hypothetical protein QTN47_15205 [Danxiaibacter flavus]|uniref:Methyltransferase n=1 Tax=Danxiaibacter flavus TaxID=3049108 RepID=A0ABV3ZG31_9BACT|nr:hypothetical protein QNM32_15215 [Chitinophagaceae bacterium DXS]
MSSSLILSTYKILTRDISLYVPEPGKIVEAFKEDKNRNIFAAAPYWARVWPASIAMATYIEKNKEFFANKKVLELAAGLGLPSLIAASYASEVCCSDYLEEALSVIQSSIALNSITNMYCRLIDWNNVPADADADVLLLSDINYEPAAFDTLFLVLQKFIQQGTSVILTTPQRLMAKPFITRLFPFIRHQEEISAIIGEQQSFISLYVLG